MFYPVHQCLYSGAFCHSGTVGVTVAMSISGIYVKAAESIDEILPPMDFSHMMVIINGSLYRDERVVKSMVNDKFSACVCKGTQICMITGKPAKFPDTGIQDFFEIPDFQMEKILLGIFKSKMNILFNQ